MARRARNGAGGVRQRGPAPAGADGVVSDRFLPRDPRVEEPYLFTPRMAFRVAALGVVALAVFAVLVLRLWSLQILSGSKYLADAQNNQLRTLRLEAPRGPILDRFGRKLVVNVPGTAIEVWPADLSKSDRRGELRRLATMLDVPLKPILQQVAERKDDPLTPVIVERGAHEDEVDYLYEHRRDFPGVQIQETYLRKYNSQALAAQVLGYVGDISPQQLKALRKQGYVGGDRVGQAGVELTYDKFLRGKPGTAVLRVDAQGHPRGTLQPTQLPEPGNGIRLTIDIALQRAAERALAYGISLAHADHQWAADGGAIVAMDPRNGEILAMASAPTFKPSVYVGRPDRKKLAPLLDPEVAKEDNYPGLNRAIAGLYPPGSTFKPVTALAALEEHVISPYQTLPCTPTYTVHGQVFRNWDPYQDSAMTLPTAIAASCDTYFYQVGYRFYGLPAERGHPLQLWASRFGFGSKTGIDIGPEQPGLLPTPEWRQATYTKKTDPCCWQIDRLWKPGDSIQLAIGQKDLLVTPLQLTRFYAMIANGGKLVTPHVVAAIQDPGAGGGTLRYLTPPAPKQVFDDSAALAVVRDGLYQVTHAPDGTASAVFGNFPVSIAGKTGTAEKMVDLPNYRGLMSQSLFCGYGPADPGDTPTIVVCAVIENGGHGGTAAAPAVEKVFEQYFHVKAGVIGPVNSD